MNQLFNMKKLLVILLLFVSFVSFGQRNQILDSFMGVKFGSSQQLTEQILLQKGYKNPIKELDFIVYKEVYFAGYFVDKVSIHFFKNKGYLYIVSFNEENYSSISENLLIKYDTPTKIIRDTYIWEFKNSKSIMLTSTFIAYSDDILYKEKEVSDKNEF